MENIKLTIAYDGTGLLGWQKTPLGPSVEEYLEKSLFQILQEKIVLQAASRTDAGVHAEGQVVNFLTHNLSSSLKRLQKSLNSLIPSQITILEAEKAPDTFHPTLENKGKEYHYLICNTHFQKPKNRLFSWQIPYKLNIDTMRLAANYFIGTLDFSTFCNQLHLLDKNPICTLHSIEIESFENHRLCIKVRGDRFLFRMVRNLVGTLIHVGCGKIALEQVPLLLENRKRESGGVTAPPHGLHLMKVFY